MWGASTSDLGVSKRFVDKAVLDIFDQDPIVLALLDKGSRPT